MTGLASATCDRALAPGAAPEWVHLLPDGHITGRDGRTFVLADPAALVLAFQSSGVDLPIDYEHQNDNPEARRSGPVPAAGWIKEMKVAADGLWGRVEWTATAREMIANREYRYLSPSILYHPQTRQIVKLKGAGLVHNPNLHLHALNAQADPAAPSAPAATSADFPRLLAEALGLPTDTAPDEVLATVKRVMAALAEIAGKTSPDGATMAELAQAASVPDPAKFVPVATVRAMLAERNAERVALGEERAQAKVAEAMRKGYLSGAMKDWALALCMSDEASFDAFLAGSGPAFAHLSERIIQGAPPAADRPAAGSAAAVSICAQLGLAPDRLTE